MATEGSFKFAFADRMKNGVREAGECLFCGGKKLSIRVGLDKNGKEVWTDPGCSTAECQTNKWWREYLDVLNTTMDMHEELKRRAAIEAQAREDRERDDKMRAVNHDNFNSTMRRVGKQYAKG
jgi:transcription elongation factor Elf1